MDDALLRLPGVETGLTPADVARLPDEAPSAPWRARARGLFWWRRATPAAADVLPAALGSGLRPLATIGALISYDETPVGPYSEIVGIVLVRRGRRVFGHVPFIAVDSAASVVGGRANWALPKTLATFTGQPANRVTMVASTEQWRVAATPRTVGPPLPTWSPRVATLVQIGADGDRWTARAGSRAMMRPARLDVQVDAPEAVAAWLPSGRCTGVLATGLTASIGEPRRS
jgi:hypothetical protein